MGGGAVLGASRLHALVLVAHLAVQGLEHVKAPRIDDGGLQGGEVLARLHAIKQ